MSSIYSVSLDLWTCLISEDRLDLQVIVIVYVGVYSKTIGTHAQSM